jgi:hypothetical protein
VGGRNPGPAPAQGGLVRRLAVLVSEAHLEIRHHKSRPRAAPKRFSSTARSPASERCSSATAAATASTRPTGSFST